MAAREMRMWPLSSGSRRASSAGRGNSGSLLLRTLGCQFEGFQANLTQRAFFMQFLKTIGRASPQSGRVRESALGVRGCGGTDFVDNL